MRHKFMFALQKNVNSPIRSSIAKIWLKFIENPPVNAIFFQDSFSRWGGKRASLLHTANTKQAIEQWFLEIIFAKLYPTYVISFPNQRVFEGKNIEAFRFGKILKDLGRVDAESWSVEESIEGRARWSGRGIPWFWREIGPIEEGRNRARKQSRGRRQDRTSR